MSKTVCNVINSFLNAASNGGLPEDPMNPEGKKLPAVNNPDILALYNPNMEVQVNVSPIGAEPVEGKRNTWSKDGNNFWHIRVPKNAMSEPIWHDYTLKWSLSHHAEAIGMTGWDWVNKKSRWLAFDFDAITGHAPGVGVTDEKLQAIRNAAIEIPWVHTRKSTRGLGFHMYVFFDGEGIPCANHTIHQGLARCILSKMSQEAGFNFATAIDTCGSNMWVWHKDATPQNEGYALVRENTKTVSLSDLPVNWKDHIDVVTRKRTKIKIGSLAKSDTEDFDILTSSRNIIPLDDTHREIMSRLGEDTGCTTIWVPEYNLLQTHTAGLAQLKEEHPDIYDGFFETNSSGDRLGEPNCFAFPISNGGWKVYRFGMGHKEHDSWTQDGRGWTCTHFNCRPNLEMVSLAMGGAEVSTGFQFTSLKKAAQAAKELGADLSQVDHWMEDNRQAELQCVKGSGRLKIRVEKHTGDHNPGLGWVEKNKHWERIYKVECNPREMASSEYPEFDNLFRATVTAAGSHYGWAVWDVAQEEWDMHPPGNVKMMLQEMKFSKTEAEMVMGGVLKKRWRLVSMPFQPEFPGNRQWNHKAPQLRYKPAILESHESPHHPHWDKILDHIGRDLDEALQENMWADQYGIKTGRQYLQMWIAALLREPFEPLPYLFLHGPQNSGKSILHEAIGRLMTGGVCRADKPLISAGEHNGELANKVLAVIEETNLSARGGERALARMKDWATAEHIPIRQMRTDTYLQLNTLHFIQCSNDRHHCLVVFGDTRITMMYVPELDIDEEIPKSILKKALENEAPHFMKTLLDIEIPPVQGRLRIPVIVTRDKSYLEHLSMNALDRFVSENTFEVKGAKVLFSDFYQKFQATLSVDEQLYWNSARKVSGGLSRNQPSGKYGGKAKTFIANMAWDAATKTDGIELIAHEGRLRTRPDVLERQRASKD